MNKTHIFTMKIPLYEVDIGGGVYHGNYYHLFELARESMFEDIGFTYSEMMDCGNHLAVAEARCTYRKPLRYNEAITISSKIIQISSRSLKIDQEIRNKNNEELTTVLHLHLVCINHEGRAAILPQKLKEAIELRG
ncbi:MAG: hypothetical protein DRH24_10430 [Deltaproteobacteria bacterium]|nr:MAG: hypothetical protein DRH24_10430 [Deltaproteobacteria bacterium]